VRDPVPYRYLAAQQRGSFIRQSPGHALNLKLCGKLRADRVSQLVFTREAHG
jgi:hypothetical protein